MALWDRISSRGQVEDRRGLAPVALGGLSLTGVAIVLLFNVLTGGDIGEVLGQLEDVAIEPQQQVQPEQFQGEDPYEVFASTVLGSANDMWLQIFNEQNETYEPPRLVLFRNLTQSSCGNASSRVGPHYCPEDRTIYLDETFFDELTNRLGAKGGDVAEAYVIAHEVGHHVQHQLGILKEIETQEDAINLELQADCFAGLWAYSIKKAGVFEPGEIEEAMDAAAAVGDDRIQEKITGSVNPETWTHGSSQARTTWFNQGYEQGSVAACNTFN